MSGPLSSQAILLRLASERSAIRQHGVCRARQRFAVWRNTLSGVTHGCLRFTGHPGPHLCGCGDEWTPPDDTTTSHPNNSTP